MSKSENAPENSDTQSPIDNDEWEVIGNFFGTVDIEILAEQIANYFLPHEVETLFEELRRLHAV